MLRPVFPAIPLRGDQLAGDAVALGRSEKDAKCRADVKRRTAFIGNLFHPVEKLLPDLLRSRFEKLVHHVRDQRARSDRVDVDAIILAFERQRLGEPYDPRLRCRIGGDRRHWIRRTATGDVDDLAIVLRTKHRHGRTRDIDEAEQIDPDGIDPLVPVDVLDIAHWAVDAGIVDENIETRKFRAELFEYPIDILGLADIADDSHDTHIWRKQRRERLLLLAEFFGPACTQQYAGAICHIVPGNLGPQPLAGAGDQRKAVLDLHRTLPATM